VQSWQLWAAAAALFAAITALLTKIGVQTIDAGLATLVRTLVVAIALALDEIDGTPGMWVAEVEEADRWESPDSEDSDDPEPTDAEQLGLLEVGR
jgi:hypothetical protein